MQVLTPWMDLNIKEELEAALSKMKRHKVGENSGILPELLLVSGTLFWNRLLELMQVCGREEK